MSGLFSSPSSQSGTVQRYLGIQVGTSLQGSPVPLIYGMTRGSLNLLWYGDFVSTPVSNGGGKGGGGGAVSAYSYSSAWAAALCEGPITGVNQVWHDKKVVSLTYENLTLFTGTSGQPIWSYLTSNFPAQAIPYDHIAYVATTGYMFGTSASMPNLSFEIQGILYGTGPTGPGVGGSFAGVLTGGSAVITGVTVPATLANGSILSDAGAAIPVGTTVSSFNAGANTVTMSTPALFNIQSDTISFTVSGFSFDADPSLVIPDYLTDPNHGAGFSGTIASLSGNNNYQGYCFSLGIGVSPVETSQRQASDYLQELLQITHSDAVISAGVLKIIPYCDEPVSGNGYSYTPNMTPLYSFTDDDFISGGKEDPPVSMKRKPLAETFNWVQLEYLDRTNQYNVSMVEAFDLNDINLNGPRVMSTLTFHQITNATTARIVAQLVLQFQLFNRNTYTFRVRPDYALLEPMDIIAITDSGLGLVNQLLRITQVNETDNGEIEIEAMKVLLTATTAPFYNWNSAQGYAANYIAAPGAVAAPLIFVMPPFIASNPGQFTLGIAVSGQSGSTTWNGCYVYVSADGTDYILAGKVTAAARYGTLTATLPSHADPDTTDTLSVVLSDTKQVLNSGAQADADNFRTLIMVDANTAAQEIMSYETAALTSAGHYNLTYLRRGAYGSPNPLHSSGATFARIDGNIFQLPVDNGQSGQTLYFKFASFNTWGQATEELSNVTPYSYTLPASEVAPNPMLTSGSAFFFNQVAGKATTGASAWDSNAFGLQAMNGACFVTATMPANVGSMTMMMGLSTTANLTGYTGLNFAIESFSGSYRIYQSGVMVFNPGISSAGGDDLLITYDGHIARYYINGSLIYASTNPGLTLYANYAFFTPGAVMNFIDFGPITGTQIVAGNFLNTWIWKVGTTGSQGNYTDTE